MPFGITFAEHNCAQLLWEMSLLEKWNLISVTHLKDLLLQYEPIGLGLAESSRWSTEVRKNRETDKHIVGLFTRFVHNERNCSLVLWVPKAVVGVLSVMFLQGKQYVQVVTHHKYNTDICTMCVISWKHYMCKVTFMSLAGGDRGGFQHK